MTRFRIVVALFALCIATSTSHAGGWLQGGWLQGGWLQGGWLQGSVLSDAGKVIGDFEVVDGELIAYRDTPFYQDELHAHYFYRRYKTAFGWTSKRGPYTSDRLVGAEWEVEVDLGLWSMRYKVRIASANLGDSIDNTMVGDLSSNGDIWRYDVEYRPAFSKRWSNVCKDSSDRGLFVSGTWDDTATYDSAGFTFLCDSGVGAKCVRRAGYKPWKEVDGVDFGPLHRSCIRAGRADYFATGYSHTSNGKLIDMFDRHGFNVPMTRGELEDAIESHGLEDDISAGDFVVEAYFLDSGAMAIDHRRLGYVCDPDVICVPDTDPVEWFLFDPEPTSGPWVMAEENPGMPLIVVRSAVTQFDVVSDPIESPWPQ